MTTFKSKVSDVLDGFKSNTTNNTLYAELTGTTYTHTTAYLETVLEAVNKAHEADMYAIREMEQQMKDLRDEIKKYLASLRNLCSCREANGSIPTEPNHNQSLDLKTVLSPASISSTVPIAQAQKSEALDMTAGHLVEEIVGVIPIHASKTEPTTTLYDVGVIIHRQEGDKEAAVKKSVKARCASEAEDIVGEELASKGIAHYIKAVWNSGEPEPQKWLRAVENGVTNKLKPSIRVTKPGKLPQQILYQNTCGTCGSEVEYSQAYKQERALAMVCPHCQAFLTAGNERRIK